MLNADGILKKPGPEIRPERVVMFAWSSGQPYMGRNCHPCISEVELIGHIVLAVSEIMYTCLAALYNREASLKGVRISLPASFKTFENDLGGGEDHFTLTIITETHVLNR